MSLLSLSLIFIFCSFRFFPLPSLSFSTHRRVLRQYAHSVPLPAVTSALAAHTSHVLWQNITVALGVKVVFFVLTMTGSASLWLAVLADMGASLVVIANGLRLLNRPSHGPSRRHSNPSSHDTSVQ